jgi:hypothetical protein
VKHSGGVVVFVNDSWLDCVSLWKQSTDGTRLCLQFQRSGAAPLFLAVVYAPPKGSPYANEGLFDNIAVEVGMIQNLGGNILLTSDFNARTSAVDDYVDCRYFAEHTPDTLPLGNDFPEVLPKRHNSDKGGLKGWHNEFLNLCSSSGLFILNGRITGDESRECTCLANGGSSLVDYMVTSPALFDCATSLVVHKCPLFCGKGGDSDHRCRNPTLAKCGGEAQHLEKLEVRSLPGLPNVQSSTERPKTPRIGVFLVSLERS